MCDRKTDIFGNVHRGQQRPLLVTGWACTALLTGEGDEHLMVTHISQISCLALACNLRHTLQDKGFDAFHAKVTGKPNG